jgi:hypothetical protein
MADTTSAVSSDRQAAQLAATAPDVLDRLNVDFEDSVLFVGRVLGDCPGPASGRARTA